jgi:hypothetical protein
VLETAPPVATQVTAVFDEPVTVLVNCFVVPVVIDADVGLIEMATTGGVDMTVTVAFANLVVSAMLVAVIVYVPGVLLAV